jgi:hypothetical protein
MSDQSEYAHELLKVLEDMQTLTGEELEKVLSQVEFYIEVFMQILDDEDSETEET